MHNKNQLTDLDQDQQIIAEAMKPESRISENPGDATVIEGTSEFTPTEASATISSSDLTTKKEAGGPIAQATNHQIPQSDQPARRGPKGPCTEGGKRRSSRNGVKFGIFSKATLIEGESRSEYQSLLEGIWKAWQPVGQAEDLQVEKLTSLSWRYRRCLVAEGAEIRKSTESVQIDRRRAREQAAERILRSQATALEFSLEPVALISEVQNPQIATSLVQMLVAVQQKLETDGFSERDGLLLKSFYGNPDGSRVRQNLCSRYSAWLGIANRAKEGKSGGYTPEQCKQNVLREIVVEIARIKQIKEQSELIESEQMKVEILRQSVPDSGGLDRLLRYESSLERAFDRALTQLERLQRMRKGQSVLPPIKIDLSL